MNKIDKTLIALAFLNTIKACGFNPLDNTGTRICETNWETCYAFSVDSIDDFDTFKADYGTADTASALFTTLGIRFACGYNEDTVLNRYEETLTTPVYVSDEILAEIVAANTCSADSTGCWTENLDCY